MEAMRSKFERAVSRRLENCLYEPKEYIQNYTIRGTYLPDFVPKREDNVLIEVKGRFRTRQEANKYIAVREDNPEITIVFVFYDPDKPMPGARKRKDGSRFTMEEWATKNDFDWYTLKTLPSRWCRQGRERE